jgi:predicted deacetylase
VTRFAIDAAVAVLLVRQPQALPESHHLVAPNVLMSDALATLHDEVHRGLLTERDGRAQLEGLAALRIRLLGDRVSRATAWQLAGRLDPADTRRAEYLAVARLQADALLTLDDELRAAADGIVPVADVDDLWRS